MTLPTRPQPPLIDDGYFVDPELPRLVADGPRRGCSVIPFLLAALFWGVVWVVTR